MLIQLPTAPPGGLQPWLSRLLQTLTKAFQAAVSQNEAAPRIILRSPDGTSYDVTVDNSGTLHTTVNAGRTA